ncbi:MAG TPA: metallophosphoesterase [Frankiaceae bacterium]|nr:metallophosphoesterase [Frankiaceae bacterium]
MRWRPREPRRPAPAALALLTALACGGPAPREAAPATTGPSATTSPSVSVSASPTPSPTPSAGRAYVIGVIGDYGVDREPVRRVVRAMTRFNRTRPLDAVLTTGDNAYCCGTRTQSEFARRLLAPFRTTGTPVYPALGNHDVGTEDGAAFMRVFGMTKRWYTVTIGPVQVVVLDSTKVSSATQLQFLRNVLAAPRPRPFRVVVFHHPGWSCSAHNPHTGIVERWAPLFGTKVDLVLTGHNHTYERFKASTGVPYVTTGGGGAGLYSSAGVACRGLHKVQYLKTAHHAVRLVATRTSLRLDGIGADGTTFDSVTVRPR